MSNKTITKEMREDLRKPLPAEGITKHPTKTYISSIKAIYVVERLNDVFGLGSWRSKVEKQSVSDKGMVVVKLIFEIPEYGIYHESYGGNDNGGENSKNFDLGDAYKGASTDALTKICSFLEIGLEVFKGKHQAPKTEAKRDITVWLSEAQFKISLTSSKEQIASVISTYTSGVKGMKKEYLTQLTEKLKTLNQLEKNQKSKAIDTTECDATEFDLY